MKRFILAACAGLLAVTMAAPSSAADLHRPAYKAPLYAPAPVFTWSGLYVGINGGYGWGTADVSDVFGSDSLKVTGALVGGTLGYNLQTSVWVWGFEGDLDYSWIKGDDSTGICASGVGCEARNHWLATGRGRLGYAFDRWMPYITGGAAFGDIKLTTPPGGSQTKSNLGWTLGGGVEYAFLGAWSVKAEYLYVDLGSVSCDASICGADTDVKTKLNIVRAGLNYRF